MGSIDTCMGILKNHNLMHLATVDENGSPFVRGVDFVVGDCENVLYFATFKTTRKIQHIKVNPNISVAIDHDCPDLPSLMQVKYIKGVGKATVLENVEETEKALGLLMQKFPFFAEMPMDPAMMVAVKIELSEIIVTDNTIEFGHTEILSYHG